MKTVRAMGQTALMAWRNDSWFVRIGTLMVLAIVGFLLHAARATSVVMQADNVLLTIGMITREALRVLENLLSFTRLVNRQFDSKYAVEGAKIGTTLNVRKPPRYIGRTGAALQPEDAIETEVPVVLNTQFGVDLSFTTQDLALSIDDFSQRFLQPAVSTVANRVDQLGLQLAQQVANTVGTPGIVPNAYLTYLQAGVKLDNNSAPQDGRRSIIMTPLMQATIVDALKGLFQSAAAISEQYMKGKMGTSGGFEWFMDQNVYTQTTGLQGGTPLVDGANQAGASILTKGWTGTVQVLNQGDVVQFAGVYLVNAQSRQNTGALQDFVVTADVISGGGGAATIPIDPPMVLSGPFQNVSGSAADGAAVTVYGAVNTYANKISPQGLAFHADAFTLACADLPLPRGVDMAARMSDDQLGLSIRMVRQYDIYSDQMPCRLDILFGWAALRPELACRVAS